MSTITSQNSNDQSDQKGGDHWSGNEDDCFSRSDDDQSSL